MPSRYNAGHCLLPWSTFPIRRIKFLHRWLGIRIISLSLSFPFWMLFMATGSVFKDASGSHQTKPRSQNWCWRCTEHTYLGDDEGLQHVHLEDKVLHSVTQDEGERLLKESHDDIMLGQWTVVQPALPQQHKKEPSVLDQEGVKRLGRIISIFSISSCLWTQINWRGVTYFFLKRDMVIRGESFLFSQNICMVPVHVLV